MMRIVEPLACFSEFGPTIFNTLQSFFIKPESTLRQLSNPKNPGMIDGDAEERCRGRRKPPGREIMPSQRSPCHAHRDTSQKKAKVPQADVDFLVMRNARLAGVATLDVF